jgi:flagellar biosynthesis protein
MNQQQSNKRLKAVALRYQPNTLDAPRVTAKGIGKIAENIIEKAHGNHIPIQEDPSLVGILSELNLNQSIPEELYQVVAEVFAFIYKTDKRAENRED